MMIFKYFKNLNYKLDININLIFKYILIRYINELKSREYIIEKLRGI